MAVAIGQFKPKNHAAAGGLVDVHDRKQMAAGGFQTVCHIMAALQTDRAWRFGDAVDVNRAGIVKPMPCLRRNQSFPDGKFLAEKTLFFDALLKRLRIGYPIGFSDGEIFTSPKAIHQH